MIQGKVQVRSHGVVVELAWRGALDDVDLVELLRALPPDAQPSTGAPEHRVTVTHADGWTVESTSGIRTHRTLAGLLVDVEADLAAVVALHSPAGVFFHAGAVGTPAGVIVLPGRSMAGKTTLVRALLARGCTYFSDEFAVVDKGGLIHPYPRRLSIRSPGGRTRVDAGTVSTVADAPAPAAAVVVLRYEEGAALGLGTRPARDGVMALIDNAVPARSRPAAVLRAARLLTEHRLTLSGIRGDADAAASELLRRVEDHSAHRGRSTDE